jgi:putative ABC transport system permease protein
VRRAEAPQRCNARVVSIFGVLAAALALQGLYGLLSFAVERSRREIGVRLSMGARKDDVVRLVAGRGLRSVVLGLAVGFPAAYAVARAASAVLFGVAPADLFAYAVAASALVVGAASASVVPALRAARIDPAATLREP